jgi:hypothetical protein
MFPGMLWRNLRGRPLNAPAAFVHPCQPTVAKQPPSGPRVHGWIVAITFVFFYNLWPNFAIGTRSKTATALKT